MISGRIALGGLSLEFGNARASFDERSREAQERAEAHARLLEEEARILNSLAELYLPELSPSAVSDGLHELESELREALRKQAVHREALSADLVVADREVAEQQARAQAREPDEAAAAAALAAGRAAAERRLEEDADYRAWSEEHAEAMRRQEVLRKRRARLASASAYERKRYAAYRPFTYLQARGYGTPDYRPGLFTRAFDRWLARRVEYRELARRELILRDGPRLVHEEVAALRARAAELEELMDVRESDALADCGVDEALPAWEAARRGLDAERERLERLRKRRDDLLSELQRVDAKKGQPWEEAIRRHRAFLENETLEDLHARASLTVEEGDDLLVRELGEVRRRLEESGRALEAARRELGRLARRTGGLAEVKREATRRFVQRRTRFPEEFRLERAMAPLLEGVAGPESVLDALDHLHSSEGALGSLGSLLGGWLGEVAAGLGSGARVVEESFDEIETDLLVYDANGKVVSRRVTRRRSPEWEQD